jgi:hypothetical protein
VSLAAHEAEWLALLRKARQSLVGKLYTAEQLKRVEDAAAAAD